MVEKNNMGSGDYINYVDVVSKKKKKIILIFHQIYVLFCPKFQPEFEDNTVSEPLVNKKGIPVLILIEFELLKPLIPARSLDDYTEA